MGKQKVDDFIKHAKYLALNRRTYYDNDFPFNSMYIHEGGVISADCIGFIKGLINDPKIWKRYKPVGYFAPIGKKIPDIGERQIYNLCTGRSNDFSKIKKGAYIEMDSEVGHAGLYVSLFKDASGYVNVIECTVGFPGDPVTGISTSYVDKWGHRFDHKGGTYTGLNWERYGYLTRWIKY